MYMRCCSTRTITNRSASSGGAIGPEVDALINLVTKMNTDGLFDAPVLKNNIGLTGNMLGYVSERSIDRIQLDSPKRTFVFSDIGNPVKYVLTTGVDTPSTVDGYYIGYYVKSPSSEYRHIIEYDGITQTITINDQFDTVVDGSNALMFGGIYVGMVYDQDLNKITFATYDPLFHRNEVTPIDVDIGPIDLDTIEVKNIHINDTDTTDKFIMFESNSVQLWKFYTEAVTGELLTRYMPTGQNVVSITPTVYSVNNTTIRLSTEGTQALTAVDGEIIVHRSLVANNVRSQSSGDFVFNSSTNVPLSTRTDKGSTTFTTVFDDIIEPVYSFKLDSTIDASLSSYTVMDMSPTLNGDITSGDAIIGMSINMSNYSGIQESLTGLHVTVGQNSSGFSGVFENNTTTVSISGQSTGIITNKSIIVDTTQADQGFNQLINTSTGNIDSFTSQDITEAGATVTALKILGRNTTIIEKETNVWDADTIFAYASGVFTDITLACSDPIDNATFLGDLNNELYIGGNVRFDTLVVSLVTPANISINPYEMYYDGLNNKWEALPTVTDTTIGFTQDGEIHWDITEIPNQEMSVVNGITRYWIRLIQTVVTTAITESTIRILPFVAEQWDSDGNLRANSVTSVGTVFTGLGLTDTNVTTAIPIGDPDNTTLNTVLGQSSLVGVVNADTYGINDMHMSGFLEWDAPGPYYDEPLLESTGVFRVLVSGTGYVDGKQVRWEAPQDTAVIPQNSDHYIGVNSDGIVEAVTDHSYMHKHMVNLWYVMRDSTDMYYVYKETHEYGSPPDLVIFNTMHIGSIVSVNGIIPTRITLGTGAEITDRQLTLVGDGTIADSGLHTVVHDSAGVPMKFKMIFLNSSGFYELYTVTDELPAVWNNAGVIEDVPVTELCVYTLGVGKNNLNTDDTPYILVIHNEWFDTNWLANKAIGNGDITRIIKVWPDSETGQIGYLTMKLRVPGAYVRTITIEKTAVGGEAVTQLVGTIEASAIVVDEEQMFGILGPDETDVQLALEVLDQLPVNSTGVDTQVDSYTSDTTALTFTVTGSGTGYIVSRPVTWTGPFDPVPLTLNEVLYVGIGLDGLVATTTDQFVSVTEHIPLYAVLACLTYTDDNYIIVSKTGYHYSTTYDLKMKHVLPGSSYYQPYFEQHVQVEYDYVATFGSVEFSVIREVITVLLLYVDADSNIRVYGEGDTLEPVWNNGGTIEPMPSDTYLAYRIGVIHGGTPHHYAFISTATYTDTLELASIYRDKTGVNTLPFLFRDLTILRSCDAIVSQEGYVSTVYNAVDTLNEYTRTEDIDWVRSYYGTTMTSTLTLADTLAASDSSVVNVGGEVPGSLIVHGPNINGDFDSANSQLGTTTVDSASLVLESTTSATEHRTVLLNADTPLTLGNEVGALFTIEDTGHIESTSGAHFVEDVRTDGAFYAGTGTTMINTDTVSTSGDLHIIGDTGNTTGKSVSIGTSGTVSLLVDLDTSNVSASNDLSVVGVTTVTGGLADTHVTTAVPLGDPDNTTLNTVLGQTSLVGTVNADTYGINDMKMSGFLEWDTTGPYYDEAILSSTGVFRILVSGTGYVDGKRVHWTAPQDTAVIPQSIDHYIGITGDGILEATTDHAYLHKSMVNLWYIMRDTVDEYYVYKETHLYGSPPDLVIFNTINIGSIVSPNGIIPTRVTTGTGGAASDRQLMIVGDGTLADSGLKTIVRDSNGLPVNFRLVFLNSAGVYEMYVSTTDLPAVWNNNGVVEPVPQDEIGVLTLGVAKNNLNSDDVTYIMIIHTNWFTNNRNAVSAIDDGSVLRIINIWPNSETGQIGFITTRRRTDGDVVRYIVIEKTAVGGQAVSQSIGAVGASIVTANTTNFDGLLGLLDVNVQLALETLDDVPVNSTGVNDWTDAYTYDSTLLEITVTNGGTGYIGSTPVTWDPAQTVGLTLYQTAYIGINVLGILSSTTDITVAHATNVPLYIVYPDSATTCVVVPNNYLYTVPFQTIIQAKKQEAQVTEQIDIDTDVPINSNTLAVTSTTTIDFYGLSDPVVPTTALVWYMYYTDASGNWTVRGSTGTALPLEWNNGGTLTTITTEAEQGFYPVYRCRGRYILIAQTTEYPGVSTNLMAVVRNKQHDAPTGELALLEGTHIATVVLQIVSGSPYIVDLVNFTEQQKLPWVRDGRGGSTLNLTDDPLLITPSTINGIDGTSVIVGSATIDDYTDDRDVSGFLTVYGGVDGSRGIGDFDSANGEYTEAILDGGSLVMTRTSLSTTGRVVVLSAVEDNALTLASNGTTSTYLTNTGELYTNLTKSSVVNVSTIHSDYPDYSQLSTALLAGTTTATTYKLAPGTYNENYGIIAITLTHDVTIDGSGTNNTFINYMSFNITCNGFRFALKNVRCDMIGPPTDYALANNAIFYTTGGAVEYYNCIINVSGLTTSTALIRTNTCTSATIRKCTITYEDTVASLLDLNTMFIENTNIVLVEDNILSHVTLSTSTNVGVFSLTDSTIATDNSITFSDNKINASFATGTVFHAVINEATSVGPYHIHNNTASISITDSCIIWKFEDTTTYHNAVISNNTYSIVLENTTAVVYMFYELTYNYISYSQHLTAFNENYMIYSADYARLLPFKVDSSSGVESSNLNITYMINGGVRLGSSISLGHSPMDTSAPKIFYSGSAVYFYVMTYDKNAYTAGLYITNESTYNTGALVTTKRFYASYELTVGEALYINTTPPSGTGLALAYDTDSNQVITSTSSINDKFNVRTVDIDPRAILHAPAVVFDRFDRNNPKHNKKHDRCVVNEVGYIADMLIEKAPMAVVCDADNVPLGLDLQGRVTYLTELCRKQQQTIEMLVKHLRLSEEWDEIWGKEDSRVTFGENVDKLYDGYRKPSSTVD